MLDQRYLSQPAIRLAPKLLGCELVHVSSQGTTSGIIVETEAYCENDPASHTFRGKTIRNSVMFGPAGHLYVYFTYGMHYCSNIVAGVPGRGEAVLLRSLEPATGIDLMSERRKTTDVHNLCSGPAKLVQAMGLRPAHNGVRVTTPELHIIKRQTAPNIMASPRIGIKVATDKHWRFFIGSNRFISKPPFNKNALALRDEPTPTN